ncbi:hypothetical protein LMJF_04_0625 [Leishmania major strain Friedlin]|uniref:Uncharacterized protein n=1 Tax=Leishmania major TaxID=5664 RepID=E9ACP8_LEIMA|nr:hypothetical protein LMJF_04_0625 [Leishmania major strain Friedlin]CAG9567735.1 hypothetical_protein_-_conserved [Leishmania major strain Friedlin]CBZ05777.1 hypothetical protein LMJF_04_0625 [Leishmania major strain Friedlin]|eukprot:XP_003723252.1 hypothetical protein LMJF_04_0625 [Leishmania major strain Friedlin]
MSNGKEQVIALLQELGTTAIPKFVDSGEALAYMAYKDGVLEKAITLLNSEHSEPKSSSIEPLRVNSEQLANAVIERVFDEHTRVLRSKLAEAEKAAGMWKKVALCGGAEEGKSVCHTALAQSTLCVPARVSVGSQVCSTDEDTAAFDSNASVQQRKLVCEAVKEWLAGWTAKMLSTVGEKLELWCSSQLGLTPVRITQDEHEVRRPSLDDSLMALDSQNSSRHAPRQVDNARLSSGKISSRGKNKISARKTSPSLALSPGENHVQPLILSPLNAAASSVPTPSHPKVGTHSPQYAQPGSQLYVMRTMSLKARAKQLNGKQQAAISNIPVSRKPHLPHI